MKDIEYYDGEEIDGKFISSTHQKSFIERRVAMGEKVVTETRFGNTLLIVTGECSPTATETIQEKLERIILRHLSDLKNH